MGKGALDHRLTVADHLRSDVSYERPHGGGEALFDLVGDLDGKRVLDYGCGHAPHRPHLEARGARWVGLDLAGPICSVVGQGLQLPFPNGAFDAVLCGAVLEHMPEPGQTLNEIHRVLAEGGLLFGYVAFLEPLHGLSYFHMSHLGLEYLLSAHGFRPTHIYPARVGAGWQIEGMLFPKPVPLVQPLWRTFNNAVLTGVLTLNRWARDVMLVLQRRPEAGDGEHRRQYRQLLALRYAMGFNFIARRTDGAMREASGYRAMVTESGDA